MNAPGALLERWRDTRDGFAPLFLEPILESAFSHLEPSIGPGRTFLDLGSGAGHVAAAVRACGGRTIVLDVDPPARLVARHCPDRTVVLATPSAGAVALFERIPGVTRVEVRDERHTIDGRREDLTTAVIQCVATNGLHVTDFQAISPTLEDVFLALTGHSIRD